MNKNVVFLDRDGVINKEKNYVYKISDFEFIEGVIEALKQLQTLGFSLIILTNQSGIGRGYYTDSDFKTLNDWMCQTLKDNQVTITDVFYCPHKPDTDCSCRKPKPGMILEAKKKYDINLENAWLVGDKEIDIQAGLNAGITQTILVRSGHNINESQSKASYICDDLLEASEQIKNVTSKQ